MNRLGRIDEAEAVAWSIAPADRKGFAPAHFWLAGRLMSDRGRLASHASATDGRSYV